MIPFMDNGPHHGNKSSSKNLEVGCVQGLILGPKLFNLYMKDVCTNVNCKHITTYAGNSYVLVKGAMDGLQDELHATVTQHLQYLSAMGMVTNFLKN